MKRYHKTTLSQVCIFAISSIFFWHFVAIPVAADGTSNINFSLYSLVEENGSTIQSNLSYEFSPTWASVLRLKSTNTSRQDDIENTLDSLYIANTSSTELFLDPARYSFKMNKIFIEAAIGVYVSIQRSNEVGYFELPAPVGMNAYKNTISTKFIGPSLALGQRFDWHPISVSADISVVPYFFYSSNQVIAISPLLNHEGDLTFTDQGYPYISASLFLTFFNILTPEISYEYQKFNFKQLVINDSVTDWISTELVYSVQTITPKISIRIPIASNGTVELGYGKKWAYTNQEGGSSYLEIIDVFKLVCNYSL